MDGKGGKIEIFKLILLGVGVGVGLREVRGTWKFLWKNRQKNNSKNIESEMQPWGDQVCKMDFSLYVGASKQVTNIGQMAQQ